MKTHSSLLLLALLVTSSLCAMAQPARLPIPFKVAAQMEDVAEPLAPGQVQLTGWLGRRVVNNERNRLVKVDLEPLLAGYQKRPGNHPWIGEHIGKWLHAATLAWANTGDAKLRAKLDGAARDLIATQEANGYLGTYTPDKRFGLYEGADWDVWSHKYNLLGLLTYYQYTGSQSALNACRKMGDLLLRTFGPGKKSILSAGTHVGMAATSILEPIVLLYRNTDDARYLDFAKYIVKSWDEPNGPHVLSTLTNVKAVNKTGNGKAYEMLSNLVGLCELARATGDKTYLIPAINAWEDVVKNQLYITGTASYGEHFHDNHDLPNAPGFNIGETCVTVTWIQLTTQLLRLTGEAKYGNELERSYYNHLAAAQRPDGAEWCYYTALEGAKPYGPGINCCVSSGPRGMAMAPMQAYFRMQKENRDVLAVNLFEASKATLRLNGEEVTVTQTTDFPRSGKITLTFHTAIASRFGVWMRMPSWIKTGSNPNKPIPLEVEAAGQVQKAFAPSSPAEGWIRIPSRGWRNGHQVRIEFPLEAAAIKGGYNNQDKIAMTWGPFVLAYDETLNPGMPPSAALALAQSDKTKSPLLSAPRSPLTFSLGVRSGLEPSVRPARFVPFAEAGVKGGRYRIWFPTIPPRVTFSKLFGGKESRNEGGNVVGSIADGEPSSFVVTYDGKKHAEDWFAVAVEKPVEIRRIVYAHGQTFHDGGWFDASKGKPRLEVKRTLNGKWETIGTLDAYPPTTATDSKSMRPGQEFTLTLKEPIKIVAVRIIGIPAHGDRPEQSFASCAELQAFEK